VDGAQDVVAIVLKVPDGKKSKPYEANKIKKEFKQRMAKMSETSPSSI